MKKGTFDGKTDAGGEVSLRIVLGREMDGKSFIEMYQSEFKNKRVKHDWTILYLSPQQIDYLRSLLNDFDKETHCRVCKRETATCEGDLCDDCRATGKENLK